MVSSQYSRVVLVLLAVLVGALRHPQVEDQWSMYRPGTFRMHLIHQIDRSGGLDGLLQQFHSTRECEVQTVDKKRYLSQVGHKQHPGKRFLPKTEWPLGVRTHS